MQSKYISKLDINNNQFYFHSLKAIEKNFLFVIFFPYSYKVLVENILRNSSSEKDIIEKINLLHDSLKGNDILGEIDFYPSRVLMQDFTGVPALADLASMRESAQKNSKS